MLAPWGLTEAVGEYSQDEYDDDYYDEDDSFYEDKTTAFEPASDDGTRRGGRSRWNGGAFSRISMGNANVRSEEEIVTPDMMPEPVESEEDEERIYHFHNPEITTEVWFVALGCELSGHNGMKAFLSDHADELRGAIIVDLEAMGAGSLSLIEGGSGNGCSCGQCDYPVGRGVWRIRSTARFSGYASRWHGWYQACILCSKGRHN